MVTEENHQDAEKPKTSPRTALFLVIYATKRGILEVNVSFFFIFFFIHVLILEV